MEPDNFMLELTETAAMTDPATTMDILTRLRVKNVGLAIDDFGTGYSSLSQLYRMPFSELKIDSSFVKDVCTSEEAKTMVDSMIYLAHKLRMQACAEGVESSDVLKFLDECGCDGAQGYFIGEPVPASDLQETAQRWNDAYA